MTLLAHLPALQFYARRLTANSTDAEDLVQDLLLSLWERREAFAGVTALRPWLMRAIYHRFVDGYRRRQASPVRYAHELVPLARAVSAATVDGPEEQQPSVEPGPDTLTERDELRVRVATVLRELPDKYREILVMREMDGLELCGRIRAHPSPNACSARSPMIWLHRALRYVQLPSASV